MVRLYFYVEGATEAGFVRRVLKDHLAQFNVMVDGAILIETARERGRIFRGGGRHYLPMKNGLTRLLKQHRSDSVRFTTMLDLYRHFRDLPGTTEADKLKHLPYERVAVLEEAFAADINDSRVIPYIQLHEFEAILFSDLSVFESVYDKVTASVSLLTKEAATFDSPELIDDGPHTAPSKRLGGTFSGYSNNKATDAVIAAELIPLATIRAKCPHFNAWLTKLENLGNGGQP